LSLRRRFFQIAALLLLSLAIAIGTFEYMRPSSEYWWRNVAELTLTKFSESTKKPIGLSASKLAFKLRQSNASRDTVRQLAEAAERHGDSSLSAASWLYLSRMDGTSEEASLQLAQRSFELTGNELTAWQYAACLRRAGQPVPGEVASVLLNGAGWEYSYLLRINAEPSAVSMSVAANDGKIQDSELFQLADAAVQSEAVYSYWSQPEIQRRRLEELYYAREQVLPLASQHRGAAWLVNTVGGFFERTITGFAKIFTDPGPMEIGSLASHSVRRFMGAIDALAAIDAAATDDDRILAARKALGTLGKEIGHLESGEMVDALEREMADKRNALSARLDELLSDPQRYRLTATLVLTAIEGKDPNELFLSEAANPRLTD